jgi:hypothetical protein
MADDFGGPVGIAQAVELIPGAEYIATVTVSVVPSAPQVQLRVAGAEIGDRTFVDFTGQQVLELHFIATAAAHEIQLEPLGWNLGGNLIVRTIYIHEAAYRGMFFTGASGGATPFYITGSSSASNSKITNPGRVESWPKLTFEGPLSTWRVNLAGGLVASDEPLLDGDQLVVDYEDKSAIRIRAGVRENVTPTLSSVDFRPVPKKQTVSLNAVLVGDGGMLVSIVPKNFRAWG